MLPELLQEISSKLDDSHHRSDWREAEDPIWGTPYFINKWSGNSGPEYDLEQRGVPRIDIKLTFLIHATHHPPLCPIIEKLVAQMLTEEMNLEPGGFCGTVTKEGDHFLCVTTYTESSLQEPITEELRDLTSNMGFRQRLAAKLLCLPHMRSLATKNGDDGDVEGATKGLANKLELSQFLVDEVDVIRQPRHTPEEVEQPETILSDETRVKLEAVRWQPEAILSFSHMRFGLPGSELLAAAGNMNAFAKLEELHLWACQLNNGAAQVIIDAIPSDSPLRVLVLDENDLEPLDWTSLAQTNLRELYLSNNPRIGARCTDIVVLKSLRVLDLSGCDVSDATMLCFMAELRKLSLRHNPLIKVHELAETWAKPPRPQNSILDCRGVDRTLLPPSMSKNGILRS
eukprot:GEMP01031770.1.p1 GENE.GEMP01031770.1~~GEMP01031770.1.p1  ORF type:complete len:400 (+),score=98.64 GEMP01031770.1:205-1404(+)